MAAPPARSWADLLADCLHEIFSRVPCAADRYSAYLTCTEWNKGNLPTGYPPPPELPPALPWLLLPARDSDPDGPPGVYCVLSGCGVHQYPAINIPRGARCFGSYDGAWLFLTLREPRADQQLSAAYFRPGMGDPPNHQLLNVRTGEAHPLPGFMASRIRFRFTGNITIHAVALSSAPGYASCVAVAIVTIAGPQRLRSVALWRMRWNDAREIGPPGPYEIVLDAEDVVYHHGAFHLLLSHDQHILVCTPLLRSGNVCCLQEWEHRRFHPGGGIYDQSVRARYLVVSRGELLLVVRFTPHPNQPTSNFKVFQATKRPQMPDADADDDDDFPVAAYPWEWSELDTLDDRILFVGHGCSRSYEVEEYKGFRFKAGIYFLDDEIFDDVVEATQYPCSDNGRWSDDGRVQLCFPTPEPSAHSAPAWLLP